MPSGGLAELAVLREGRRLGMRLDRKANIPTEVIGDRRVARRNGRLPAARWFISGRQFPSARVVVI